MENKYLGAGIIHFIPSSEPYDDTEFKHFKERLEKAYEELREASYRENGELLPKT